MGGSEPDHLSLIYDRLCTYLSADRFFTRPGLNRTNLASAIRTNEKYLAKAIRKFAGGKSLGEFIDCLRLEYACELLKTHPEYTVEAISRECGMTSKSSFYRLFRKYLGCSPGEYMKETGGIPGNGTLFSP